MKMHSLCAVAIAAAVILSACGNSGGAGQGGGSFGVSVDKSESTNNENSTSLSRSGSQTTSDRSGKSVKMNASALVVEASGDVCRINGASPTRAHWLSRPDKTLAGKEPNAKYGSRALAASFCGIAATAEAAQAWSDGDHASFMRRMAALAYFANDLATEAASSLNDDSLNNPSDAKRLAIEKIQKISDGDLEALFQEKVAKVAKCGQPDDNGSGSGQPIEFLLCGDQFSIGPQGLHLTHNGSAWYGDGRVSGRNIEVSLDTSIAVGFDAKSSFDSKESLTKNQTRKVEAGLKH